MKCIFTKIVCCACVSLLFTLNAFAQDTYYKQPTLAKNGYWRLFTDYTSRSTIIKFYNASQQVIYEETIPGKYIKLNKKNVRRLNQTLDLLSGNQLIASTVKSVELLADQKQSLVDLPATRLRDDLKVSRALNSTSGFRLNTDFLTNGGKLNIVFENLQKNTIKIRLQDEGGRTLYRDQTTLAGYSRTLDLKGMQAGRYTLTIKGEQVHFKRIISLSYKNNHPHIQSVIKPTDSTLVQSYTL